MPLHAAPVLTGRMVSVVVFLVFLVGGGSALATVAFLSGQEPEAALQAQPGPLKAGVEPGGGAEASEEATQSGEMDDSNAVVPSEAPDETPPLEAPADEAPTDEVSANNEAPTDEAPTDASEDAKHGETPVDDPALVIEDDAPMEGGQDIAEGPGEAGTPAPDQSAPSTSKPRTPEHETAECAKVRDAAEAEYKARRWGGVLKLVRKKACWSSAQRVVRTRMQVRSLAELKRFGDCVKAGRRSKDPETQVTLAACEKQVNG